MGAMARTAAVAGTATKVAGGVRRRSARKDADQRPDAAPADQQPEAAAAAQPTAALSVEEQVAKIKALGELKDSGLLTDEEFAAEKAKVLAS
jgi:hypothetical protein